MPDASLNRAYYGPSVPPRTTKSYHRSDRGGGSCNPFGCLFSCICNCICQLLCTLVVVLGAAALVLWLVFRPNKVKFYVDDATLTQFDLSPTNNTLYYNLALNMSIRNPNKRIGVYYDYVEASAFYTGQRFSTQQNLGTFYQGHKNTSVLDAAFKGQQVVPIDRSSYDSETKDRVYQIDVKLYMRIRLKVGSWIKTRKMKPTIECDLKVPLEATAPFERTRCHLDW